MQELFNEQRIIIEQFKNKSLYKRELFNRFVSDNLIYGIVGLRGIGKTTYLLHKVIGSGALTRRALYVLADGIYFLDNTLIDLVDKLYKETDVKLLCIDEIHKYQNWNQELKNISDVYPSIQILFSGSSTIDLIKSTYDLSRRVTLYHLQGLSFREYLEFFLGLKLPVYSLKQIIDGHIEIANSINVSKILKHFKDYLSAGYYPFFKEFELSTERFQTIRNTTQKTIYEDIATMYNLKSGTLRTIEQLFQFVLNSSPGEINANKLAKNLGKDFTNISSYLHYLYEAGLIRFLFHNKTGHAYLRNPVKMYPDNSNLLFANFVTQIEDAAIGKIRETFFISQLQNASHNVYYSEIGDFEAEGNVFEIGGQSKTARQILSKKNAYLVSDGIIIGEKRKIPLYLFGFLY